jgi:SprT protein
MASRNLPQVPHHIQIAVSEKLVECKYAMMTAGHIIPEFEIRYDLGGRTAGQAGCRTDRFDGHTYDHYIRINPVLLVENEEEMINDTVVHEFCHVIQHANFPHSRSHGAEWQRLMIACGVNPTRTHNMDTSNAARLTGKTKRKFQYGCDCSSDLILSSVRHNKIVRGRAEFSCKKCHGKVKFIRELGKLDYTEAKAAAHSAAPAKKTARPVAKPVPTRRIKVKGQPTKMAVAMEIVRCNPNQRSLCITSIMVECGMTKAGASTYFYNAKKKLGV